MVTVPLFLNSSSTTLHQNSPVIIINSTVCKDNHCCSFDHNRDYVETVLLHSDVCCDDTLSFRVLLLNELLFILNAYLSWPQQTGVISLMGSTETDPF